MSVVRHPADRKGLELIHARDPGHVGPKALFQIERDDRPAFLGGKYAMKKRAAICVGHASGILAPWITDLKTVFSVVP
jgi:hypothetical protein